MRESVDFLISLLSPLCSFERTLATFESEYSAPKKENNLGKRSEREITSSYEI